MGALVGGALAEGFPTDLWTLPRVGTLIARRFGRTNSESQVWRILVKLGFSCQRPSSRALERNGPAIQRWPAFKKTPCKAQSSFSSTRAPKLERDGAAIADCISCCAGKP